jgi:hypothetical protein
MRGIIVLLFDNPHSDSTPDPQTHCLDSIQVGQPHRTERTSWNPSCGLGRAAPVGVESESVTRAEEET